jgi:hypothetical protein
MKLAAALDGRPRKPNLLLSFAHMVEALQSCGSDISLSKHLLPND